MTEAVDSTHLQMVAELYLDLMKKSLTRVHIPEGLRPAAMDPYVRSQPHLKLLSAILKPLLRVAGLELARPYHAEWRAEGKDWPLEAETMIGLVRLQNLQDCATEVLRRGIPGDFIETGVWRGGASIFLRAILKAHGDTERTVWVADSFEGLPKPDGRFAQDEGDRFWTYSDVLGVSLEQVRANFEQYGLLDEQVRFLPGWFKDSLPTAPIGRLSLIHADGDMYSSITDTLENLYPKLSSGGYAIIDDYNAIPVCRRAADEFRERNSIREPIQSVDWSAAYWVKN